MRKLIPILISLFLSVIGTSAFSQVKGNVDTLHKAGNVATIKPNLVYRVQIATVDSKSKIAPILKHYGITEEPYLENENTTAIKVLIGNYPNYSMGKARVDELKHKGLKAAFLVPYYKGSRVSLQEAASHTGE